jgi:hypothetical protein
VIINQIPAYGSDLIGVGDVVNIDSNDWIQVEYLGERGWVNNSYLAEQHGNLSDDVIKLGQQVLFSLKSNQILDLKDYLHPEWCLRFSPYQYLSENDQVFCPAELEGVVSSGKTHNWGAYDGTGDPILMTFQDYQSRFIYDNNFFHSPIVGYGVEVSSGNAINNIPEIFPNGMMVEYYFPGFDPQYGGMDWRSLRLVFVQDNDIWYLTAIIHGEWTI